MRRRARTKANSGIIERQGFSLLCVVPPIRQVGQKLSCSAMHPVIHWGGHQLQMPAYTPEQVKAWKLISKLKWRQMERQVYSFWNFHSKPRFQLGFFFFFFVSFIQLRAVNYVHHQSVVPYLCAMAWL